MGALQPRASPLGSLRLIWVLPVLPAQAHGRWILDLPPENLPAGVLLLAEPSGWGGEA